MASEKQEQKVERSYTQNGGTQTNNGIISFGDNTINLVVQVIIESEGLSTDPLSNAQLYKDFLQIITSTIQKEADLPVVLSIIQDQIEKEKKQSGKSAITAEDLVKILENISQDTIKLQIEQYEKNGKEKLLQAEKELGWACLKGDPNDRSKIPEFQQAQDFFEKANQSQTYPEAEFGLYLAQSKVQCHYSKTDPYIHFWGSVPDLENATNSEAILSAVHSSESCKWIYKRCVETYQKLCNYSKASTVLAFVLLFLDVVLMSLALLRTGVYTFLFPSWSGFLFCLAVILAGSGSFFLLVSGFVRCLKIKRPSGYPLRTVIVGCVCLLLTIALVAVPLGKHSVVKYDYADAGVLYNMQEDSTLAACNVDGYVKDAVVPSELKGSPIVVIQEKAFSGKGNLKSVTVEEGIIEIGDYAFYACDALCAVALPDSIESIGKYALSACSALENITIGSNVTSIGFGAFRDCGSLTSVTYTGTMEQWEAIEKGNQLFDDGCIVHCTDGDIVYQE